MIKRTANQISSTTASVASDPNLDILGAESSNYGMVGTGCWG
jgi:hypothetical protein